MKPTEFIDVGGIEDLDEGQMIAGDVRGKRVLLAKVAGSFFAIGGICTHERANLDEGSLIGHVVYCPLHQSAFDVRSGHVLGPPADQPTPAYKVKVEHGRILISADPVNHPLSSTAE